MDYSDSTRDSAVEKETPITREEVRQWWEHPILLTLIGVVILAVAAYTFLPFWADAPAQTDGAEPSGTIFMTLFPEDPADDIIQNFSHAYVYDINADALAPLFSDPSYAVQHSFSHNRRFTTFFGGEPDPTADYTKSSFTSSLYRAAVDPQTLAIRNAEAMSTIGSYAAHAPAVSNDGAVLFSSLDEAPAGGSVITQVDDWTIRLIVNGGEAPIEVTSGTYPKWVDANRFVFLKNNGIYYYDFRRGEERALLRLSSGTITSNTKLSVSPTGRYIAWTDFDAEILYVFEVMDWNVEAVRTWEPYIIPVAGFWSVFSPDEKFIAVQAVDADTIATNPNPRLEFYNLATRERYPLTVDLNDYDQEYMFVTDWR